MFNPCAIVFQPLGWGIAHHGEGPRVVSVKKKAKEAKVTTSLQRAAPSDGEASPAARRSPPPGNARALPALGLRVQPPPHPVLLVCDHRKCLNLNSPKGGHVSLCEIPAFLKESVYFGELRVSGLV